MIGEDAKRKKLERNKQWKINNKERTREYNKQWRDSNKERKHLHDERYRNSHQDEIKEAQRLYRERNKEKIQLKKKNIYNEKSMFYSCLKESKPCVDCRTMVSILCHGF